MLSNAKGGDFEKATEVLSTTLTGTLSMLSDKLFKFRLETGKAGFFAFIKQGLVEVNKLIEANDKLLISFGAKLSNTLIQATKSIILGGAVIIQAIKPIFTFLGQAVSGLLGFLQSLPEGVRTFGIIGFLLLGGTGKLLVLFIGSIFDKIRSGIGSITNGLASFYSGLASVLRTLKIISDEQLQAAIKASNDLKKSADKLQTPMKQLAKETKKTNSEFDQSINKIKEFLDSLEEKALVSQEQVEKMLNKLKGSSNEVGTLSQRFTGIKISLKEIAESLLEQANKKFKSMNEIIAKGILSGINSISRGIAESIVLGKKLEDTFRSIAQTILIGIIQGLIEEYVIKKALLVIDKLLGNEAKKKENEIKKQNAALQQQIALQAVLLALGGGGGGGFGFGAEGGQVKGNRADGGSVAGKSPYIVGERGRELFIPNQDGEIVSNERLQNLGATVNFTINATDVKGVKELLIDNRATIVNIINGALNQKGKAALV